MEQQMIFSVSEANNFIKALLDRVPQLQEIFVRGEISNYKLYPSGHHYFTLKDAEGAMRCVLFKGNALRLRFRPENGMKVIAFGRISVFPRDGAYQLYVSELSPEGAGDLHVAKVRAHAVDLLIGFVPLAGDENDVVGAGRADGLDDRAPTIELDRHLCAVCFGHARGHRLGNRLRVFASGIVACDHDAPREASGRRAHQRALAVVAVAPGAKDGRKHPARTRSEHFV